MTQKRLRKKANKGDKRTKGLANKGDILVFVNLVVLRVCCRGYRTGWGKRRGV